MVHLPSFLTSLFVVVGLVYIIYLRPKYEKLSDDRAFDDCALGYFDGLQFPDKFRFGDDLRRHLEEQLAKAHSGPSNRALIEYTAKNGFVYRSWTGRKDYHLFVILCIAQYAKEYDRPELVEWCESVMEDARRAGI